MPLNEKRCSDAINIVLKLFESIARDLTSINIVRTNQTQTQPTTSNENNPISTSVTQTSVNTDSQELGANVNLESRTNAETSSIILGMFGKFVLKIFKNFLEQALLPENADNISSSSSEFDEDSAEEAVEGNSII